MLQNPQKTHYENIHNQYEAHYFDATSLNYRKNFIFNELVKQIDIDVKMVADVACGSGGNTSILLTQMATDSQFIGFDISEHACQAYIANTGFQAHCHDLTEPNYGGFDEAFDIVMIIGGLHHMVNDLTSAAQNIMKMLKPGGILLVCEPNSEYLLNGVRDFWYKRDKYFESGTERALSVQELDNFFAEDLKLKEFKYFGGPAYFLIYNSLITRVPLWIKKWIEKPLLVAEKMFNKIPSNQVFPAFWAVWKKV